MIYGLCLDPITGMLWANSGGAGGRLVEIDSLTGLRTGKNMVPGFEFTVFGFQGGLDCIPSGVCDRAVGGNDLVVVQQGPINSVEPDRVIALLLNHADDFDNSAQEDLRIGKNGTATRIEVKVDAVDTSIDFSVSAVTGSTSSGVLYLTTQADSRRSASIRNLVPGNTLAYLDCSFTLPAFSPSGVAVSVPIVAGSPYSIPVPALPASLSSIGAQAVMVTGAISRAGALPIYATNRVVGEICP